MNVKFMGNVFIDGEIKAETGMHIGGSKAIVEIGGIDNIVIKDPLTGFPIIPGSSLKGKLRSLLELSKGKYGSDGKPHSHDKNGCSDEKCLICRIFGTSNHAKPLGPTRLIVRDAFLSHFELDGSGKIHEKERLHDLIFEIKTENYINRLEAKAESPRHFERVSAGAVFQFSMVFGVYVETDPDFLTHVVEAMLLLEDSYLGGHGSRGYGKVIFKNLNISIRSNKDYQQGTGKRAIREGISSTTELQKDITSIITEIKQKLNSS